MKNDDYRFDSIERSQRQQTRQRRDNQSRRRRLYWIGTLLGIALLALAGPSLISHSPIGRSLAEGVVAQYGVDAEVGALRVGWITPLRISDLTLTGRQAGSTIRIAELDTELTVMDLVNQAGSELGVLSLRGVDVQCSIQDGQSSIEQDLKLFWDQPSSGEAITATVNVHELTMAVTDTVTKETWILSQASTEMEWLANQVETRFAGVLAEPRGSQGSLQGSVAFDTAARGVTSSDSVWQFEIVADSLPLSVSSLLRRRFTDLAAQIPAQLTGDATGSIQIQGAADGKIEAMVKQFQVRNLAAANPQSSSKQWTNKLATLDGRLQIKDSYVIGNGLVATTDFASIQLDGAFSTSITLVGASNNPLRWLDALEGVASAELDLASFDRAMPGVLPIRREAELVSGRIVAVIESLPSDHLRRRRLSLRSDAIRGRSNGQPVMVAPLELTAIVSSDSERIRAEQFNLSSSFATASGQGGLQTGSTDIEVDFGRLADTLRPMVDIPDSTLAGSARGTIKWAASGQNEWRLIGSADARELSIAMPSGKQLRQESLRVEVDAVGKWNAARLDSLDVAHATLSSPGLSLRAELVQAILDPDANAAFPIRIQGEGRLENLADTFAPWMPAEVHGLDGGFTMNARADVSASGDGRLTATVVNLTEPRIAYGELDLGQPWLKLQFEGDYNWITSELQCQTMTVEGDAVSAAVQGEWTAENTDLEIAWKAMLQRVQSSVKKRMVSQPMPTMTSVGYRSGQSVDSENWLVMGDCDGRFIISQQDHLLRVETELVGKRFAIVQPATASAAAQRTGPLVPAMQQGPQRNTAAASHVVWAEPNVKVNGVVALDPKTGKLVTDSLQVASDWFATNLSGHAVWNAEQGSLAMKGPARIKMDEVATRVSPLAGVALNVYGVHETPIEINVSRKPDGQIALDISGHLGWQSGQVAGVDFGEATIPIRLTETTVFVSRSAVPVGRGKLNLAGDVNYRPGPLWMRIEPGRIAESVRVTPEMTDRWLKYLAPLASQATRIEGTLGAEIDEAIVVFDAPSQSRVVGRLNIEALQMDAGPMGSQIIGGMQQLRALSQATSPQTTAAASSTLIRMPAQTVDFVLDHGVVNHKRMYFDIDRANVVTSGNVTLDGRLDLVAQIPLDERWLGSDLRGLAGQPVTLPVDGTLSRPSLDSSGVRKVVSQLGIQTIQSNAENYLQKQVGKGIERLFGR
ncbi:hypothetical protein [Novipirellula artificiosorum]|uniref:AsmA-like C-terminal domain-containing protein n=1 Tax=Novipirellula artificiosorum TaxID=2528016 RepID=A0A5C6DCI9_9BACT|nr:hypothetical protein [Novipirellula artificiosorum]TWU34388.1 hypothetical protein Poly41_45360 [Novipirellula artificiosorum]